jgi:inner membrane protein
VPAGLEKLQVPAANIIWKDAFLQFSIVDIKGLNDEMTMNWNNQRVTFAQDDRVPEGSLAAPVSLRSYDELNGIAFNSDIQVSGSEQLLFTPVGKSTTVLLTSAWPHPSFIGSMLPQGAQVKDSGFTATWKSVSHKRSFPQQWKDNPGFLNVKNNFGESSTTEKTYGSSFGVDLFIPVNNYQKTLRSVKYAAICILLTFATFFLIETTHNRTVHPFQYGLAGLALILFYTLLLSFSEYIGFNLSYVIASVCTIGLIAWFARGILGSGRLTAILTTVLLLMYTYVFTILQLQDYSLLLGSIGLFITLAIVMHFSKKLQW